ncbi:MAG: hypothetical protein GX838_00080, partial [Clostridiaceae bacterium]|nr:hypothetical protein [Clostridiaceae bacterium]
LGLPETGTLATQYSQVEAAVNWNLDSCSYDPADKDAQTFHVYGSFVLPEGVINPYGIPLTTGIMVTVLEEVIPVYTVVYDGNGATGGATANSVHVIGQAQNLTKNGFTRNFYLFTGWSLTAGGPDLFLDEESVIDLSDLDEDTVTLYAAWQPVSYSIIYEFDGGTACNPSSYTAESNEIKLNPPQRAGYAFAGWSGTGISCQTMEVIIPQGSTGDRTYTAHWRPLVFSIFYRLEGGTVDNPSSYTIESEDIQLNPPQKDGHVFTGWSGTEISGQTMGVTISKGSTGDRFYTAHWEAVTGLPAAVAVKKGESLTWDPKPAGGSWKWDREFFSARFNSPATFTALKAGCSTITYSVGGGSQSVTVTILAAEKSPGTGQSVWASWLIGLCWLSLAAGAQILRIKRENFTS